MWPHSVQRVAAPLCIIPGAAAAVCLPGDSDVPGHSDS
jgi:hypothetical protein